MSVIPPLPDTGERMVPELSHPGLMLDHLNRYRFALPFVRGRRVLDIACGEGYGTAALVRAGAAEVIGMDLDGAVVDHAKRKYGIDGRLGAAEHIPLPDSCVDVVVSFETIEHLPEPQAFVREAARILASGGKLIISTPNKERQPEGANGNPYHHSEMDKQEFRAMVERVFADVHYFSQRLMVAPLLSRRALAAQHTAPRCRLLSGLIFRLRPWLCSESGRCLDASYRSDPVVAVAGRRPTVLDGWFDPSRVRPWKPDSDEQPMYFIAIAGR